MFNHIVLYKLKNNSQAAKDELKQTFLSMEGNIEQIKYISVGTDVLNSERSFDVSLFIKFQSKESFFEYKNHPFHVEIAKHVAMVKEKSVSLDYID